MSILWYMGNRVEMYHNPKCRKSREVLQILRDNNINPSIILYLDTPPDTKELSQILRKMGKKPRDIFRKSEPLYKELGLKNKDLSDEKLLGYLNTYPILIERPIVVNGQRAVIGRPPEDVKKII